MMWTKTEIELPPDNRIVAVVCIDKPYGEYRKFLLHDLLLTGKYCPGYGWIIYGPSDWFGPVEVSHWCLLPEPPKDE